MGCMEDPTSYLDARVNAAACATMLDVTAGQWRRIAGTREAPNPDLPPLLIPGERGAQWHLRDVLTLALAEDRTLHGTTCPPLLPLPTGPRYTPVAEGLADDATGYQLTATRDGHTATAWAQLFTPTAPTRCGQTEKALLLLTPLWPTTDTDIADLLDLLITAAGTRPGWIQALAHTGIGAPDSGLAVVVLPVGDLQTAAAQSSVQATVLSNTDTDDALSDLVSPYLPAAPAAARLPLYPLPAADIAGCLGWDALPWWPAGTATATTCPQWEPGSAVDVEVPEPLRPAAELAHWITTLTPEWGVDARDLQALAASVDPAHTHAPLARAIGQDPAVGFELAAHITWAPVAATAGDLDTTLAAQRQVMGSLDVPEHLIDVLLERIPDPDHAEPVYIPRDLLPTGWAHNLEVDSSSLDDLDVRLQAPAWRRVLAAHHAGTRRHGHADTEVDYVITDELPGRALVAHDQRGITIAAPTAIRTRRITHTRTPADTICAPDRIATVCLLTTPDGEIRGLYRTTDSTTGVLPAQARWRTGLDGQAAMLVAALVGRTHIEALTGRRSEPGALTVMEQLLASTAAAPKVLTGAQLVEIARDSTTIRNR